MQVNFPLDLDVLATTEETGMRLGTLLRSDNEKFILISGESTSFQYAETLLRFAGLSALRHILLKDNSVANVYAVERSVRSLQPSRVLAVGGGKVSDFAKRLAYIMNLPLVLAPTIIANDGLISPVSVLQDHGKSVSLAGKMPDDVLIDMSMVLKAPKNYLVAASCDLITNLTATDDWIRAAGKVGEKPDFLAVQFARMASFQILDCRSWDVHATSFTRSVVFGQVLSGIAMALAGSSRPCSGSEHLISHALDALGLGLDVLHGMKVGVASRFCLFLQETTYDQIEEYFSHFSLPRCFPGCVGATHSQIAAIFAETRKMRPGRITILDEFSDQELIEKYFLFIALKEHKL